MVCITFTLRMANQIICRNEQSFMYQLQFDVGAMLAANNNNDDDDDDKVEVNHSDLKLMI